MKIERIIISDEDAARLTTDHGTVDRTLKLATDKLNIARMTGDYLYVTAVKLAFLCQRLYNELDELRKEDNKQ